MTCRPGRSPGRTGLCPFCSGAAPGRPRAGRRDGPRVCQTLGCLGPSPRGPAPRLVCDLRLWLRQGHVLSPRSGPTKSQRRGVWGRSSPDTLSFPRRLCSRVSLPADVAHRGGGPQASPQSPAGPCSRAVSAAPRPAGAERPASPDDGRAAVRRGPAARDVDAHVAPALKMRVGRDGRAPQIPDRRARGGRQLPEALAEEGAAAPVRPPGKTSTSVAGAGLRDRRKRLNVHARGLTEE